MYQQSPQGNSGARSSGTLLNLGAGLFDQSTPSSELKKIIFQNEVLLRFFLKLSVMFDRIPRNRAVEWDKSIRGGKVKWKVVVALGLDVLMYQLATAAKSPAGSTTKTATGLAPGRLWRSGSCGREAWDRFARRWPISVWNAGL